MFFRYCTGFFEAEVNAKVIQFILNLDSCQKYKIDLLLVLDFDAAI